MSSTNDPKSDSLIRNVAELSAKRKNLTDIKKSIKDNPDHRYVNRKEIGKECKELAALICDELDDGGEVVVGTRRFKKQRTEQTKYSKDRVREFFEQRTIDPNIYDLANTEDKVALKAVGKRG